MERESGIAKEELGRAVNFFSCRNGGGDDVAWRGDQAGCW